MIPKEVEQLLKSVSSYFCNSPKRSSELEDSLKFMSLPNTKILKLSGTRWLEAFNCYERILLHWPALLEFFRVEVYDIQVTKINKCRIFNEEEGKFIDKITNNIEDKDNKVEISKVSNAEKIYDLLQDNSIKAYAYFLKFTLNYYNSFNALYQTKALMIHKLSKSILKILMQIGSNFLKEEALSKVSEIDFDIIGNCKPLTDIFLGPSCAELLIDMPVESVLTFRTNCLNFYVNCFKEMRKRFLEHYKLLSQLNFVEPQIALSLEKRKSIPDLNELRKDYFPFLDAEVLAFEWRNLPLCFDDDEADDFKKLDVESFWKVICDLKNDVGNELRFPTLKKLTEAVFSLPHSSV